MRYLLSGVALMACKYALDAGAVYAATGGWFTPLEHRRFALARFAC